MSLSAKNRLIRLVTHRPVYRMMPPGSLRDFAAVKYHGRGSWEQLATFARGNGVPDRHLDSGLLAARAAFRAGDDDLVGPALERLQLRFPQASGVHELWCDYHTFRGDLKAGLASAQRGLECDPRSTGSLSRAIRLTYRLKDRAEADALAADAVRRFPRSVPVLSTICKELDTAEQYDEILRVWRESARKPTDLVRVVRQLGNGALRTSRLETAASLYRDAMVMIANREARARGIKGQSLATRSAWTAIADLVEVLDQAGVPFFFAAGTALGLVRQGRPLGHDDDIDVGILDQDWDRDLLLQAFAGHPRFTVLHNPQSQKVGVEHRAGSRVDVFRFYQQDGKVWHDGVFVRWHNTPFEIIRKDLDGVSVALPADSDRYLTENYGDWRTPNPNFDAFTEDAPNVEITWPEYLRLHFIRRAYRKLVGKDPVGAAAELRRAEENELADRLENPEPQPPGS